MSENDDFPYRNNLYTEKDKIRIFNNLIQSDLKMCKNPESCNYKPRVNINMLPTTFLFKGMVYYLTFKTSDYFNSMILSDLFNDDCRMKCGFGDYISPVEYYKKNKNNIINIMKKKNIEITPMNIREEIYEDMNKNHLRECSNHNPSVIKKFIKIFKSKKVLDMSSGWGDRLLGAMASGVDMYIGVDPNPCLHPNYKNMIDTLLKHSPNPKGKFIMFESPFESLDVSKITEHCKSFDLVYTSPPYFDYEKYTEAKGQSHLSHNTQDKWFDDFLIPSINKCISLLKNKGYLVLYFTQERGKSYMEPFLKYLFNVVNLFYLGCVHYSNENFKGSHPIFIFKKQNKIPTILYNFSPVIENIGMYDRKFNVIRDDYIVGGTKTRAALLLLKKKLENKEITKVIYGGAANGYAQVCISYCLYLLKRDDVELILPVQNIQNKEIDKLHELVYSYHTKTTYKKTNGTMKDLYPIVDSYTDKSDYVIPFGFHCDEYEELLFIQLKKHYNKLKHIKRLWLVVGSGTILRVLQRLLKDTLFFGVQVGRTVKDEEIYDKNRLELYISSYKFYQDYPEKIKYNSMMSYDAKVLEFVKKFGKSGDYIWNVAGIHRNLL